MNLPLRSLSSVWVLLLASCGAGRWTEAEKTGLSSLALPPASIAADAYAEPIGSEQVSAPFLTSPGSDFATGAAVGVAAQLVVEIAAAAQQQMFEKRYADAITRAPGSIPGDLPLRIRRALAKSLGEQAFFKGRIRDDSPNRFTVIVENYRYIRAGKEGGEVLVTPVLFGRFELINASGKKLLNQGFTAPAAKVARPLTVFAHDKALAAKAFDSAIANLTLQAVNAVNARLGEAELAPSAPAPSGGGAAPVQLANVNGGTATCKNPYLLTQSCNLWSGAGRAVTVGGEKLKIAGSADGRIVLVRGARLIPRAPVSSTGSVQYEAVKRALRTSGVGILRQRDMVSAGTTVGFFLELDGDGYSVLAR
jgi:hypothetical protein